MVHGRLVRRESTPPGPLHPLHPARGEQRQQLLQLLPGDGLSMKLHRRTPKGRKILIPAADGVVPLEPNADIQQLRVLGEHLKGQEANRRQVPDPLRFQSILRSRRVGDRKPADLIGKARSDELPPLLRGGGVRQTAEKFLPHCVILIVVGGGDGQQEEERVRIRGPFRQLLCAGSVRMLFVKRQNFPNKVLSAPLNMVFHVLFSKLAIPQGPLEIRAVEKGFRLLPGPVLRSAG